MMELRMIPAHRVGNFWKFKFSKIDDWILYGNAGDASSEPAQGRSHQ
jgi:hypothetical protein